MRINQATPMINNQIKNNNGQNTSFKGLPKGVCDFLTLERRGPMIRTLFLANAFGFLLGSRLITSRDKEEKREILIRDLPTIGVAVMGVPVVAKWVAKGIQKKSGFVIMEESEQKT